MSELSGHRLICFCDMGYSHRSCSVFEVLPTCRFFVRFKRNWPPGLTGHAYDAETAYGSSDEVYSCPTMLLSRCAEGFGQAVGPVLRYLAGKAGVGSRPSKNGTASTEDVPGSVFCPLSDYDTRGIPPPSTHLVWNEPRISNSLPTWVR